MLSPYSADSLLVLLITRGKFSGLIGVDLSCGMTDAGGTNITCFSSLRRVQIAVFSVFEGHGRGGGGPLNFAKLVHHVPAVPVMGVRVSPGI